MEVTIKKGLPRGAFVAPPSKSYAHRLLIGCALSGGRTQISKIIKSEDVEATLDCIRSLGTKATLKGGRVSLEKNNPEKYTRIFECRESGSTLRFFIPIALARGGVCEFRGSQRLISRGISVYEDICARQGISVTRQDNRIIFDGALRPDAFEVRGDISSQFISGLLLSLPLLDGDSTLKITTRLESRPYVDMTIDSLSYFGIEIEERAENEFFIKGNQHYEVKDAIVEGDFSNAAFLDAFAVLGADVSVKGINSHSLQGDKIYKELFKGLSEGYLEADISSTPDLAPILFALCAAKHGGYITGTSRLKIKESDRAQAMASELSKLGIRLDVYENAVKINKGELKAPTQPLCSHNDHRIAMALSVLATLTGATITEAQAVAKSFPTFFNVLRSHGVNLTLKGKDKPSEAEK